MNKKPGRNDPCPCGSKKKYKQCCMTKSPLARRIKQAVWINAPKAQAEQPQELIETGPNLIERTFGSSIADAGQNPQPFQPKPFHASINPPPKKNHEEDPN